MIKVKKSLVVGGGGFVGTALVAKLITQGERIRVVKRTNVGAVDKRPEIEVCVGDIADPVFCASLLTDVDVVYYVAGYKKNIQAHQKQPFDFVLGNCEPLLTFLKILRTTDVTSLIYVSSVQATSVSSTELNGYALGKYINERLLEAFRVDNSIHISVLRFPGIYGPGDHFGSGANFIPALIERVAKSDGSIEVWGTGLREIQFMYIDDVVENMCQVSHDADGVFFMGNPEIATIARIVDYVQMALGTNHVIRYNTAMPDGLSQVYDFSGNVCTPKVSLEEGIRRTAAYYKTIHTHHV